VRRLKNDPSSYGESHAGWAALVIRGSHLDFIAVQHQSNKQGRV